VGCQAAAQSEYGRNLAVQLGPRPAEHLVLPWYVGPPDGSATAYCPIPIKSKAGNQAMRLPTKVTATIDVRKIHLEQ
jgi:hypothetical protein